jgi:hypothetical protein
MSNLIKKATDFYQLFECVDTADCQAIYIRDGYDSAGERTDIHCYVKMTDGKEFHNSIRKLGNDYRLLSDNAEDIFLVMIKDSFHKHLNRKAA